MNRNIQIFERPGNELSDAIQSLNPSQLFVLMDENTKRKCYPEIKNLLPKHHNLTIKPGERFKNIDTCLTIWQFLTDKKADRESLIINLGGGVICDLGGFCAATFKRGINFMHLPTTLLSMADASIGGKLGIDFLSYKNQIGVFKNPALTYVYPSFLNTLPHNELLSGFAEIIKHCLLSDEMLWKQIIRIELEDQNWLKLLEHSISFKSGITADDPFEKGLRKILNFGHTIGHAIEAYFLSIDKPIHHGFAIAAGMLCEAFISNKKTGLPESALNEIQEFILTNFPILTFSVDEIKIIIQFMFQDKKNVSNQIRMVLLENIGKPIFNVQVNERVIYQSLKYYLGM